MFPKSRLWACATTKVFTGCITNNSGAGGAAIYREKKGESLEQVYNLFNGAWFCPGFKKYFNKENSMPFDQHFLLACVAPKLCLVNTAYQDTWADSEAQYLACEASSVVWENYNTKGLVKANTADLRGERSLKGRLGFTNREGAHCFSRIDWLAIIDFLKEHKKL